ncbi:MAG TPA: hypothetical protein VLD65_09705 [Anaerolineales bacterium]|nr:hypothetical protein [Anaerolineales bacterium]
MTRRLADKRIGNLCYNKARMDTQNRQNQPQRNPKTHLEHRREVFWQISLPLVVGILIILATLGAIVFATLQPVTDVERWADVSLIWLILPSLFFALIFLAILAGFIYLVSFLLRLIPRYTLVIQLYFEQARSKVGQLLNLSIEPILRINSIWAAIRYASERGRKPLQD